MFWQKNYLFLCSYKRTETYSSTAAAMLIMALYQKRAKLTNFPRKKRLFQQQSVAGIVYINHKRYILFSAHI